MPEEITNNIESVSSAEEGRVQNVIFRSEPN
jgi:hypothetical protein